MTKPRRPLTPDAVGLLLALLAVLPGGFIYLYQPWQAGFPINDGGLFYAMIRAVQTNGFMPPDFVAYNGVDIPFAYPPLGFYLGAALSSLLQVDALLILQWVPAVILIIIGACFYFAAREFLASPIEAGLATLLYVCTPASATWLIMGGGITRSLGVLFLLLTVTAVHRMNKRRTSQSIAAAIFCGSMVVLAHPEAALHSLALSAAFWLIIGRSRRSALDSAIVAAGVALLTSIWWVPILLQHGLDPVLSALETGGHNALAFVYPLFMMFTDEPAMTIVAALGVIGFFLAAAERQWLLPAWLLVPFFAEPRSARQWALLALAMLAARALHEIVFPALAAGAQRIHKKAFRSYIESGAVKAAAVYLGIFLILTAMYSGSQLAQIRVSPGDLEAFKWVSANTAPGSRFLVLTGANELFCDPVQEWFPVLTGRVSSTAIQGSEWLGSEQFRTGMARLRQVASCENGDAPAACFRAQVPINGLAYDHIYVQLSGLVTRGCRAEGEQRTGERLLLQLQEAGSHKTVHRTDGVEILEVLP